MIRSLQIGLTQMSQPSMSQPSMTSLASSECQRYLALTPCHSNLDNLGKYKNHKCMHAACMDAGTQLFATHPLKSPHNSHPSGATTPFHQICFFTAHMVSCTILGTLFFMKNMSNAWPLYAVRFFQQPRILDCLAMGPPKSSSL